MEKLDDRGSKTGGESMIFSIDLLRIGYVIAVKYDRKKKFNLISDGIFQRQLWQGFNSDDACFTHVAISSGDNYLVNVSPPKAKLVKFMDEFKGKYIKILKYSGTDFERLVRYKVGCIYNAIASNLGYDWMGVLSFILPAIKQVKSKPFCSEACAQAFKVFYPFIFGGIEPSKVMPANFLDPESFDVVWEGEIPK